MAKEKILIVGGGFGGVKAALELAKDNSCSVTLLSDSKEMRYYPALYRTATGGAYRGSSIFLDSIFEGKDVRLEQATAINLDRKSKTVGTKEGQEYEYDSLILSLGMVTNYFGIPGLDKYAYGIKTQADVQRFKRHLHDQLIKDRAADRHYVVIGAGPTGIELAGGLPGYIKQIMRHHGLPARQPHVEIVEALPRLLPRMPKQTSRAVARRLRRLGIKLYLGKAVQSAGPDELMVAGKPIRSHTVVWTAGVANHPFFARNDFVLAKNGRVAVDTYLQAEPDIFVIGDNANTPYSGMAQTALEDGEFVASNLRRRADGKRFKSYRAKAPITVIPVGPHWASMLWGRFSFNGRLGWLLRLAGDLVGLHDIEPWPKAARQFLHEFEYEDDCPVCAIAPK